VSEKPSRSGERERDKKGTQLFSQHSLRLHSHRQEKSCVPFLSGTTPSLLRGLSPRILLSQDIGHAGRSLL
jgi:hypothetical protein